MGRALHEGLFCSIGRVHLGLRDPGQVFARALVGHLAIRKQFDERKLTARVPVVNWSPAR